MKQALRHPWAIVAVVAAITVFFASQIPRARLENDNMRFIPADDPEKVLSNRIEDEFGSQNKILIGFEREFGTVIDADFLARLRAFEEKALLMKQVEDCASIVSADYIEGRDDSVIVSPLVPEDFGGTREELASLGEKLRSWEPYRRSLVSDDLSSTQLVVSLVTSSDPSRAGEGVAAYRELSRLAKETFPDAKTYFAGMKVLSSTANSAMKKDLAVLLPLVILAVLACLFLSFGNVGGMLLPILTTLVATVWTIGAMPLFGIPLSVISIVLPVIMIAVGSAYGIHLVSHYYDGRAAAGNLSVAEHRDLVIGVVGNVWFPVFLASLTTFAGFVSFCFTSVIPVREFGAFASFGVLCAFLIAVTLIPSLILIRGPGRSRFRPDGDERVTDRFGSVLSDLLMAAYGRKKTVIAFVVVVVAVSLVGVTRVVIDNVMVEYFRDDNEVVRSDRFVRERFGGIKSVSVVVSDPTPGAVLRPDVLAAMDGLASYLTREVPGVGKVLSFTDMIKRVNQVVNADASPDGLSPADDAGDGEGSEPQTGDFGFANFVSPGARSAEAAVPGAAGTSATGSDFVPGPDGGAGISSSELAGLLDASVSAAGGANASAADVVDAFKRSVNFRGAAYYEIPVDPARYGARDASELKNLVSNYLVLLSSGDMSSYSNDALEPTSIRMNVQLRTTGQIDTDVAVRSMRAYVDRRFPKDVKTEIGGKALVEKALNERIVQSQVISVVSSLAMVFVFLALFYRSFVAGLLGLVPLGVSILVDFAIMGFAGIKLNIGTSMVASISVGIGIDYTIHCIDSFRRQYSDGEGFEECARKVFRSSGKAIVYNGVSVAIGFSVLIASSFSILSNLGTIVAISMVTSALASLTLLPALLGIFMPAFIVKPRRPPAVSAIELASEVHS